MFVIKLKLIHRFIFNAIFLVALSTTSFNSYAKDFLIDKIIINGEKRLSESFLLKYVPKFKNGKVNDDILNQITKNLYQTGYFSDVKVIINQNKLEITVDEFPIVNEILFSGNDILDEKTLLSTTNIKTRDTFNKQSINEAIENIRVQYQNVGRYLSTVNVKKVILPEGRVNLIFEIKEGPLLYVEKINFTGNKFYSDQDLKQIISTKENAWYKIFGANKFDPSRLEFDKEKLYQFYKERGFINFKVKLARGDLLPDFSGFNINFIVEEGLRFKINNVSIQSDLKGVNKVNLNKKLLLKKGQLFDIRALNENSLLINDYYGDLGYSFVKVIPKLKKTKNLVDIIFFVQEGRKTYINKISILGNTRTLDSVVRRELLFLEGDAYNKTKLKESISSLKRLGYFKSVSYRTNKADIENSVNIIINVEEMNTGSVSLGVGYSSLNSTSVTFGLNEKNFLGEGRKAKFQSTVSEKQTTYNIALTEPYFLDKPISFSSNIFNTETENTQGDIKSDRFGLGLSIGIKEKLIFHSLGYSFSEGTTTIASTSTANSVTGEEGKTISTSSIKYSLSNDTRDNVFNPSSGHKWSVSNTLAGFGGDTNFLKSIASYKTYHPINYGDYKFAFKLGAGFVTALDDKITSSNRFSLSGSALRGFDNAGIGPRDKGNNSTVGGNNFYNSSIELKSDRFMPDDTGIEWLLFTDMGSLWGTDYEKGVQGFDDAEPRITSGFGLLMNTAVGPLQFLWGFPIQSKKYDVEENFQFSLGTMF